MNIFTFTGNLGKDCEIKYLQSGTPVCVFSVAVESGYGEKTKTSWVRCTLFGKRAEGGLPQYLKKGSQVCVSGELTLEQWNDQQGITQKALGVNVREVDLIGGRQDSQQSAAARPPSQSPAQGNFQAPDGFDSDQEIPF